VHPLNHLKIHPPSILRLVIVLTCACLVSPPLPLFAEELQLINTESVRGDLIEFLAAEGKLPTPNDDLELVGEFGIGDGSKTELKLRNLNIRQNRLFLRQHQNPRCALGVEPRVT